jgi:hypothetical protein
MTADFDRFAYVSVSQGWWGTRHHAHLRKT